MTRRMFGKLAAAAFAKINSRIDGVTIGAQTYSFRDRPLDGCIAAMKEIGLGEAELYNGHIEPKGKEELAAWRKNPPLDEMRAVRRKFDDAGIDLYALNYSFREEWGDPELEAGFAIAKAMGVKYITASSNVSTAKRLAPMAEKHRIVVAFHDHSNMAPNEFARPQDFEQAMSYNPKWIGINLDIGHFTAAGFDAVDFIEKHHDKIVTLHIKDRKKNQGANMPFGEGDTPIKPVLQMLKTKHWAIPANIEYEYKGGDTVAEVKKCFDYCKAALA
jgi:sugar phosphate isomerase/epimerase